MESVWREVVKIYHTCEGRFAVLIRDIYILSRSRPTSITVSSPTLSDLSHMWDRPLQPRLPIVLYPICCPHHIR